MIDRKTFFDIVRVHLGPLKPTQVTGFESILTAWEADTSLVDPRWLAYMLATAWHETACTMQPIAEYGHGKGKSYGVSDPVTHQAYYGRGYVQLTWKANYEKFSKICGVDMTSNAELALEPSVASKVMFYGMEQGTFTGKRLSTYFSKIADDPLGARRIINGTDQASRIAGYYKDFLEALTKSTLASAVEPVQAPPVSPLPLPQKKTDGAVAQTPAPAISNPAVGVTHPVETPGQTLGEVLLDKLKGLIHGS